LDDSDKENTQITLIEDPKYLYILYAFFFAITDKWNFYGVFAKTEIEKGKFVIKYEGELISNRVADFRSKAKILIILII